MKVETDETGLRVTFDQEDQDNFVRNYGMTIQEAWARIDAFWFGPTYDPFRHKVEVSDARSDGTPGGSPP